MPKQELLIQLIVGGRPGWQVRVDVPRELCRKMTDSELKSIGKATLDALGATSGSAPEPPAAAIPEPTASSRKRR